MKKVTLIRMLLAVAAALLVPSLVMPALHGNQGVAAAVSAPTVELAYDDGIPWKTAEESGASLCDQCYAWQGVRFDLRGAALAALTAVRFYAGGRAGTLQVVVTNAARLDELVDPLTVEVSAAQWYGVTLPETMVMGDFWVWVKTDGKVMPYHDAGTVSGRSYMAESYKLGTGIVQPLPRGDLMIRAIVRAELHVGEGQDYATIQEAVGAAGEGLVIVVHEGTYIENVVVNKKLWIMSNDGPSNTIVRARNAGSSAFSVTASGVTISGFSIEGASGEGAGGVYIDSSSDCSVTGNSISGNYHGIAVFGASKSNLVVNNDITFNVYGVWLEGQGNNISGNRIRENSGGLGSGVYMSGYAADNEVHFNVFGAATGVERTGQVFYDSPSGMANAVNNWWGSASGPYHEISNPGGNGVAVGDEVRFSPWLRAEPIAVKTAAMASGSSVVDARAEASTAVLKVGAAAPTVWVARYGLNPGGQLPEAQSTVGPWIDVYFNETTNVESVEIRVYYVKAEASGIDEGSLRLYWWDGMEWMVCSRSGVNAKEGFVWAVVKPTGGPALAALGGVPFVIGTTVGGFAWWWVIVGIAILVVVVAGSWFVLKVLRGRGYRDYGYE